MTDAFVRDQLARFTTATEIQFTKGQLDLLVAIVELCAQQAVVDTCDDLLTRVESVAKSTIAKSAVQIFDAT